MRPSHPLTNPLTSDPLTPDHLDVIGYQSIIINKCIELALSTDWHRRTWVPALTTDIINDKLP